MQELGNLIVIYDDNRISIEDNTVIAKSEDVGARYEAYGWHVQHVSWVTADGYDENVQALYDAIEAAKAVTDKPSFIVLRTIIGWPAPSKQNTMAAHGSALGDAEVKATKEILGFDPAVSFPVEEEALSRAREVAARGKALRAEWDSQFAAWEKDNPERGALFARLSARELPDGWEAALPAFPADPKGTGTRRTSGKVLTALAPVLPELWGGSADLAESNNTTMEGEPSFLPLNRQSEMWPGNPYGRTLHFGIREHGMGTILNGITLSGLTRPYGGTFLQFSDYMRGSVRLAALMEIPVTFVWTHDSIGLGEDGPTHQPVEHLWSLRNIPHLDIVRPADANETVFAWKSDPGEHRPSGRPRAVTAERADVRPDHLRPGRADRARRLRDGGRHRRDPDRDRLRGADRGSGTGTAARPRASRPGWCRCRRSNGSTSRMPPTGRKCSRRRSVRGCRSRRASLPRGRFSSATPGNRWASITSARRRRRRCSTRSTASPPRRSRPRPGPPSPRRAAPGHRAEVPAREQAIQS